MLDHQGGFGMVKDTTEIGDQRDDWPNIHRKIMAADILVIGTPIWLGVKSSAATLAIERLYAFSGDKNQHGPYRYSGKAAGCVVSGNEDGVKAVSVETWYALSHIGYAIPPQADCGWLGDIGPGPSYGDLVDGSGVPAGSCGFLKRALAAWVDMWERSASRVMPSVSMTLTTRGRSIRSKADIKSPAFSCRALPTALPARSSRFPV